MANAAPVRDDVFSDYERTTDAGLAEPWQLETMRAWQWPAGKTPTVETYCRLRIALSTLRTRTITSERPKPLPRFEK